MNLTTAILICEKHTTWVTTGKNYSYNELNSELLNQAIQVLVNNAKQDLEEDGWSNK